MCKFDLKTNSKVYFLWVLKTISKILINYDLVLSFQFTWVLPLPDIFPPLYKFFRYDGFCYLYFFFYLVISYCFKCFTWVMFYLVVIKFLKHFCIYVVLGRKYGFVCLFTRNLYFKVNSIEFTCKCKTFWPWW